MTFLISPGSLVPGKSCQQRRPSHALRTEPPARASLAGEGRLCGRGQALQGSPTAARQGTSRRAGSHQQAHPLAQALETWSLSPAP